MYADIALIRNDKDTDRLYTYEIPESYRQAIGIGSKVSVSFGKGKGSLMGFVFHIGNTKPEFKTKKIERLYAPLYRLTPLQISLCLWMRERYLCTYSQAIKTIVHQNLMKASQSSFYSLYELSASLDSRRAIAEAVSAKASKQLRSLEFLLENGAVERKPLMQMTGISANSLASLIEKGHISVKRQESSDKGLLEKKRRPLSGEGTKCLCLLDTPQREAHYFKCIAKAIENKESVLIVSNEMMEAARLHRIFSSKFTNCELFLYNSSISLKEMESFQKRLFSGVPNIVFGTRNALFLPFANLGLIIIDNENAFGHKSESMPKFHTNEVAEYISDYNRGSLLVSDICPSLAIYHRMTENRSPIIGGDPAAEKRIPVSCVDMKSELRNGNTSMLSRLLVDKISNVLKDGSAGIILFMNRKSQSSFVSCRSCGYAMACPECGISLTYHSDEGLMRCSQCAYSVSATSICPECGSRYYRYFGLGPEKVIREMEDRFKNVRIQSVDSEKVRSMSELKERINAYNSGDVDVLVGTELILKRHLLKRPSIFAVLNADMFLHHQDYQSNESYFYLMRKIRSCLPAVNSQLLIQTYNPDQYVVKHALNDDYLAFYEEELRNRRILRLPPYRHLAVFHLFGDDGTKVSQMAERYGEALSKSLDKNRFRVLGPGKCDGARYKYKHGQQFVVRYESVDIPEFKGIIKYVNENTREAFRRFSVKLSYDIDTNGI